MSAPGCWKDCGPLGWAKVMGSNRRKKPDARMDDVNGTTRHLRNEAAHLPGDLGDLLALRASVIAAGHSRRVADGLCAWLLGVAAGDHGRPDAVSGPTRARYRRILAELDGEPPNVRGAGRPRADGPVNPEDRWVAGLRRSSKTAAAKKGARRRPRRPPPTDGE
jgi:hypothetical protein